MKKNIIVIMTVLITLCLSACGSNNSNNQTIIFEQRVNDQYLSIIWEDREYVPYCAINPKNRGAFLGYLEDESQVEIYEFDGYSSEEWLIHYLNIGFGGGGAMLFKEISVQNVPDGFYSEYDWNNVVGEE
ncbi:MAG: hypothetical protein NC121_02565 [Blautia sp.]|nr:hypothetical protein [Blautia sp.]